MSFEPQQPSQQPPTPQWGQSVPQARPKWARKRVVIPAALVLLAVGAGLGGAGGTETASDSKAAPGPTVTVTAKPAAAKAVDEAEPAPTVTVTKTVKAKPKPKPEPEDAEAPAGKAVFKVWGKAAAGVDITYGSDSENLDGSGLPMEKTLAIKDDALYYAINAQLQGGGEIQCSVTIDGKTKSGRARGGYNICSAQLNGDFFGGFS